MTLVRYGQAAILAAILSLTGNTVWAQEQGQQSNPSTPGYINFFTAGLHCCKDANCCKDGDCCSNSKKCEAKCTCCKDSKCACCKDGECGCDKNGKCSCGKDKTSSDKNVSVCYTSVCPFLDKLAKHTAIIMVMPASMPLPPCCMEMMGMMPHPSMPPFPMPPGPHVFLPPPPMMAPMPPMAPNTFNDWTTGLRLGTPPGFATGYAPCPTRCCVPCSTTSAAATKVSIAATPSSDQLEVSIGEETCLRCKKMTVKVGEKELRVSRSADRVHVRGEKLNTTADCVRTDGKDRLILEGDVVLHYKKEGQSTACVMKADHIELNVSSGTVTGKTCRDIQSTPAVHINRVDNESR